MSTTVLFVQFLIGLILLRILREIKLAKCAIKRLEWIRSQFSFDRKDINKAFFGKDVELFPIKESSVNIFGSTYNNEQKERLADLIDSEAAVNIQLKSGAPL